MKHKLTLPHKIKPHPPYHIPFQPAYIKNSKKKIDFIITDEFKFKTRHLHPTFHHSSESSLDIAINSKIEYITLTRSFK